MRILIFESDTNRQRQLRTILASLGHKSAEIETVPDAKSATNLMRKKRFEVIFISTGAGADRLPFLRDLKGGAGKGIVVIVYSADVTKENVLAAVEAGATTFLGYPFSVSDVEGVLKQFVK